MSLYTGTPGQREQWAAILKAVQWKKPESSNKMATRGMRSGPKTLPPAENAKAAAAAKRSAAAEVKRKGARANVLAKKRLQGSNNITEMFPTIKPSPNGVLNIKKISQSWEVQPPTVVKYITSQYENHGVRNTENLDTFIREIYRASEHLPQKKIKAIISSVQSGKLAFLAPQAARDPNRLRRSASAMQGATLDELLRKFTPSLRQAHSGSRLETFSVALAAREAGKLVLAFSTEKNKPPFNFNKVNGAATGSEITQIWRKYRGQLENGIFVLKSKFNLDILKNGETNPYFQNLIFRLVKENAVGPGHRNYIPQTSYNKPGRLSLLKGKNAETSIWKGFGNCEPDVLYFYIDENGCLHIIIFEFKIGLGKPESVPAEYFQLVKAKRVLEKLFGPLVGREGGPPCLVIEMFFFPFRYGYPETGRENFAHPRNSNAWRNNGEKLSNNNKLRKSWMGWYSKLSRK